MRLGIHDHIYRNQVFAKDYKGTPFSDLTDAQLARIDQTQLDVVINAEFGWAGYDMGDLRAVERKAWKLINSVRTEQLNRKLGRVFDPYEWVRR